MSGLKGDLRETPMSLTAFSWFPDQNHHFHGKDPVLDSVAYTFPYWGLETWFRLFPIVGFLGIWWVLENLCGAAESWKLQNIIIIIAWTYKLSPQVRYPLSPIPMGLSSFALSKWLFGAHELRGVHNHVAPLREVRWRTWLMEHVPMSLYRYSQILP